MRLTEYQEQIVRKWAAEHHRKGLPVAEAARRCDLRDGLTARVNDVVGEVYRALDARKGG